MLDMKDNINMVDVCIRRRKHERDEDATRWRRVKTVGLASFGIPLFLAFVCLKYKVNHGQSIVI